jgi:RNA recognition motif-containing protein
MVIVTLTLKILNNYLEKNVLVNDSKTLLISNLQRPFTQIQLQELFSKSGNITNMWLDQIKTHCYIEVNFFI